MGVVVRAMMAPADGRQLDIDAFVALAHRLMAGGRLDPEEEEPEWESTAWLVAPLAIVSGRNVSSFWPWQLRPGAAIDGCDWRVEWIEPTELEHAIRTHAQEDFALWFAALDYGNPDFGMQHAFASHYRPDLAALVAGGQCCGALFRTQ